MYLNVTLSATDTEGFCNADIAASVFLKEENSYNVKQTEISKHCSINILSSRQVKEIEVKQTEISKQCNINILSSRQVNKKITNLGTLPCRITQY